MTGFPHSALWHLSIVLFFILFPVVLALLGTHDEAFLLRAPPRAAEESSEEEISDIGSHLGLDLGSDPESEAECVEALSKPELRLDHQFWTRPLTTTSISKNSRSKKDHQGCRQHRGKGASTQRTQGDTQADNEITGPSRSGPIKGKGNARMAFEPQREEKLYNIERNGRNAEDEELFGAMDGVPFEFIGESTAREIPTDQNAPQRRPRITFRRAQWKNGKGK